MTASLLIHSYSRKRKIPSAFFRIKFPCHLKLTLHARKDTNSTSGWCRVVLRQRDHCPIHHIELRSRWPCYWGIKQMTSGSVLVSQKRLSWQQSKGAVGEKEELMMSWCSIDLLLHLAPHWDRLLATQYLPSW